MHNRKEIIAHSGPIVNLLFLMLKPSSKGRSGSMPVMGEQAQVCKVHVGSILDLLAALGEVFSI